MDDFEFWSLVVVAVVLVWTVMAYLTYLIFNSKSSARKCTEFECAKSLMRSHRLTIEMLPLDSPIHDYAVKSGKDVLFLTTTNTWVEDILDYYGRLPEDFKVNYKGKVVLR